VPVDLRRWAGAWLPFALGSLRREGGSSPRTSSPVLRVLLPRVKLRERLFIKPAEKETVSQFARSAQQAAVLGGSVDESVKSVTAQADVRVQELKAKVASLEEAIAAADTAAKGRLEARKALVVALQGKAREKLGQSGGLSAEEFVEQYVAGDAVELGDLLEGIEGDLEDLQSCFAGAVGASRLKTLVRQEYVSLAATPIHDQQATEGATTVRDLALNETVEVLEFAFDEAAQCQRAKIKTYMDGKIGWVTHSATLTESKAKFDALIRDLS